MFKKFDHKHNEGQIKSQEICIIYMLSFVISLGNWNHLGMPKCTQKFTFLVPDSFLFAHKFEARDRPCRTLPSD